MSHGGTTYALRLSDGRDRQRKEKSNFQFQKFSIPRKKTVFVIHQHLCRCVAKRCCICCMSSHLTWLSNQTCDFRFFANFFLPHLRPIVAVFVGNSIGKKLYSKHFVSSKPIQCVIEFKNSWEIKIISLKRFLLNLKFPPSLALFPKPANPFDVSTSFGTWSRSTRRSESTFGHRRCSSSRGPRTSTSTSTDSSRWIHPRLFCSPSIEKNRWFRARATKLVAFAAQDEESGRKSKQDLPPTWGSSDSLTPLEEQVTNCRRRQIRLLLRGHEFVSNRS